MKSLGMAEARTLGMPCAFQSSKEREDEMSESVPMPMCPMAETCKGMMEKPLSGFTMIVPGIVLILLGVAVIIEPRILVWLVAVAFIVMGLAMMMLARFMRSIGERFQGMHR